MFFSKDSGGQTGGIVAGVNGDFGSAQDAAGIHFGGNQMDGTAAYCIAGFEDGAMDALAVHAGAAVFGQEGGVDVKDASGPALGEMGIKDAEPAGESGKVNSEGVELIFNAGTQGILKYFPIQEAGGYSRILGAVKGAAGAVGDYEDGLGVFEPAAAMGVEDGLEVGAAA